MVRTVRSVPHRGLRDWILQRLSAIIIAIYALWLGAKLACEAQLSFAAWHHLFSQMSVKIATLFFLAALMPCLDWDVDYLYGLCQTFVIAWYFARGCSSYVSRLLYLGLNDFMGCLINESGNTYV